jgi:hypothetical protein
MDVSGNQVVPRTELHPARTVDGDGAIAIEFQFVESLLGSMNAAFAFGSDSSSLSMHTSIELGRWDPFLRK